MVVMLSLTTGCATTQGYFTDRGRDACDTVTLSVEETGVSASAQVLFWGTGLGRAKGSGFGLRSGIVGNYDFDEFGIILGGKKSLALHGADDNRGKGYGSMAYQLIPIGDAYMPRAERFNFWCAEVSLCLGVGARAGCNFAEILDFILGWFTIDILNDDLEPRKAGPNNTLDDIDARRAEPSR